MGKELSINNNFLLYTDSNGKVKVDVLLKNETIWLTINQMAELFGIDKSGISRHIKNIFETGELQEETTVAKIATVQLEGTRKVNRYLDYAELQAKNHRQMFMKDWRNKLDAFLQFNGQEILQNSGNITKKIADKLAEDNYQIFHKNRLKTEANQLGDIDKAIENLNK